MANDSEPAENNLRAWREFRGLSRAQLAELVDTNTNMILYLETGQRGLSEKWVRKLGPVLDITPGWLFDHSPENLGADIIDIWGPATARQRRQIVEVAKAIIKTGTDD